MAKKKIEPVIEFQERIEESVIEDVLPSKYIV